MGNLKNRLQITYLQNRNKVADVENKFSLPGGKRGGINWEIGIDYTHCYI